MDKVGGKKQVAGKKKKQTSENKIRTVKKMRGGEENKILTLDTASSIRELYSIIYTSFHKNIGRVKNDILKHMGNISRGQDRIKQSFKQYIFYIFRTEPRPTQIISAGIISGSKQISIVTRNNQGTPTGVITKHYLFLRSLLSRERGNRGGTSAIYHILTRLPEAAYSGICLNNTPSSRPYYNKLGFHPDQLNQVLLLDKTPEIMRSLEKIIQKRGPIITEFYSTYPGNRII
jgi:hypothetical protein